MKVYQNPFHMMTNPNSLKELVKEAIVYCTNH
jgi:hypothetical protein